MENTTTTKGDPDSNQGQPREPGEPAKIFVKATMLCPSCGHKRVFKNKFNRKDLDMLVVSAKVMSWVTCDCGDLMEFSLEFDI